jgi:predicted metal-dependent phosphoesterase TrpH
MKRHLLLGLAAAALLSAGAQGEGRCRTPIRIPDLPGYLTLKCDFHMHTVFSDGLVWPDVRAEEAWRQGLDAIAITDHIEYQPHKADLPTKHNRSYEIAKSKGDTLNVIVIHGSEITRQMPPGHLNAIFLTDSEPLDTPKWQDAVRAAARQNAFIFWNHPGWKAQQPDGVARWYPEHEDLLKKGWLNGIEVVNSRSYYPEAHRWCLEKKLTMLSNSDIHPPLAMDYDLAAGEHRPLTLVFATERSAAAIKEALFARRTAVYSGNRLIGEARFLRPIFERSITIVTPRLTIRGKGRKYAQIRNDSDLNYELQRAGAVEGLTIPASLTLRAGKTVLLEVRGQGTIKSGTRRCALPYRVTNLLVTPEEGLPVTLPLEVTFAP